ncbi:oncoprotein-induced transcript 3 protein-like [Ptychodera flava]|uniref:oncoprotein-induced transcript 3 protein-like n=1 Tax=Ptychodera flava TaxID=63121 RepID=UPI00396A90E9
MNIGSCHTSTTDPCVEYIAIDEPKRSSAYVINSNSTDVLSDANELARYRGWYRFVSAAGGEMASEDDVDPYHCGTVFPLYLDGSHPTVQDGIVSMNACADIAHLRCAKTYAIEVKNCSTFYVYNLVQPSSDGEAYCAGSELRCEEGYISPNGNFTPGCTGSYHTNATDPCVEYVAIDEPKRSSAYVINRNSTDVISDANELARYRGWYRFVSAAGGEMASEDDVGPYHCGTVFPLYLDGSHPTVEDGIVSRIACADIVHLRCANTYAIEVKNCSTFYVYNLVQPRSDGEAYCAGSELRCEEGYISPNGNFTPGCTDLDECRTGVHKCAHLCVNTKGSYYCECRDGHQLSDDNKTCRPVPSPSEENGGKLVTCNPSLVVVIWLLIQSILE